jgi:hypothetical protein
MTIVKAAAVQMSPVLYSREGTVDRVVRKITEPGRQSAKSPGYCQLSQCANDYLQLPLQMVRLGAFNGSQMQSGMNEYCASASPTILS